MDQGPLILAIETSCDETSAAVVSGRTIHSNIVSSQVDLHRQWGGIVPEAAARAHVESILPVIDEALTAAKVTLDDIGAVAVTNRPGLVGALSVGVSAAKAIAYSRNLSLLGIHHLEGHLASVLGSGDAVRLPHVALVVSGGHTECIEVRSWGDYRMISHTIDDAAGEAFDKGARLLGLGYPGGPAIEIAACAGDARRYSLPKGLSGDSVDFSFSGLKTALMRLVEREGSALVVADAAASLQQTVVKVLVERSVRVVDSLGHGALTLVGGVAANSLLRAELQAECDRRGIQFATPPLTLCTDNAAMIGLAAAPRLARGQSDPFSLDVHPTSELASG